MTRRDPPPFVPADVEVAGLHLLLFGLGGVLLALPSLTRFHAVWIFVVAYNLFVPIYLQSRGLEGLTGIWLFVVPISLLQVIPDWFLCTALGTLEFPAAPGPAAVPGFMAGLWVPALFVTTYVGARTARYRSAGRAFGASATAGLLIFAAAELIFPEVGIWIARDVHTTAGLAWYILGPEILLCVATLYAYRETAGGSIASRLVAAAVVMLLYLGAASASYLLIEHGLAPFW